MDERDLIELLHGRKNRRFRRGWRCPDETLLTAYVDRRLDMKARESFEAHLADCDSCLSQVSFLAHSITWAEPVEVPPQLLARARSLVSDNRRTPLFSGWHWAGVAAAACVLIAFATVLTLRLRRSETPRSTVGSQVAQHEPGQFSAPVLPVTPAPRNPDVVASANSAPSAARPALPRTEPSAPAVRNAESDNRVPKLTLPREGSVLKRQNLEFRWQTVADAIFYEVSIVTAAGDPVIVRQTDRTRLDLSPEVQLISGAKYFVSVRAHLREGQTARSSVVSFRVSD